VISRWTRLRVVLCGVVLALAAVRIGRRAVELQVQRRDELHARAEDQYLRDIELLPQRGRILDRKGVELAASAQFESVSCSPRRLLSVPGGVDRLAAALKLDRHALARTIERAAEARRYFAWVKRTVTPEEAARVRALALPGVRFDREPKRVYPGKEAGATVIGFTDIDGRGTEGVERALDARLRGTVTRLQGMRDGSGRALLMDGLDGLIDHRANAGKDVVLTLDSYLTFVTHSVLVDTVKKWHAKGGTSVMLDPATGDILAMASVPSYDPNAPGDAVAKGFTKNRAVTDLIEPGSTMKVFTLAATLDAGKVKPGDTFDCLGGRPLMIGKSRVRDLHPEGVITAAQVLQRSNNIGTVKIARLLGKERLYEALRRFGFGRRTGVGLEGERPGLVYPAQKWGDIHFANIAFGYGLQVTPLQMVVGYAALANGGLYRPPRLAWKVVGASGKPELLPPPAGARPEQRVLSRETARTMLEIMTGVTGPHGTARGATIDGFRVAGKTGTAQKVVNGRYGPWISSFIGIVPADDPRLVIAVIIDEPEPEHRGGMVAAPAFKAIAEAALRYLAVPPDPALVSGGKPPADGTSATSAATAPAGAGPGGLPAAAAVAEADVAAEIVEGPGSDQPLWGGPEDLDDGAAALVDGEGLEPAPVGMAEGRADEEPGDDGLVTVPSFVGMSIGEAIRAASEAGVEITPEGSGLAVTQSPPPGPRAHGVLCRVSFRPGG
jgi:cell division protein FtsI (penicillin-binding protein 3)